MYIDTRVTVKYVIRHINGQYVLSTHLIPNKRDASTFNSWQEARTYVRDVLKDSTFSSYQVKVL